MLRSKSLFGGSGGTLFRTPAGPAVFLLFVIAPVAAIAADVPWYQHDACRTAHATVMSAELKAGRAAIAGLQRSPDLELRACGMWLEVPLGDVEFLLQGKSPALSHRRMRRLQKLFKFAMRYGRRRPHLLDLAIEARIRRVRVLVEQGQSTAAIREAQKVEKMLDARQGRASTPSRMYARGISDLAVAQAPWALRVLVKMAGMRGEPERGRRLLESLGTGTSVYRADALAVLYHFARKRDRPSAQEIDSYGARLARHYAQNPQFVFDHALDQFRAGRCADSLAILQPMRARLHADPVLWSPRTRKKVYWLTGRCALDTGNRSLAKQSLVLAVQEKDAGYAHEVERLKADLSG